MVLQPKPVDYPRIRRALSIYKVTSVITGVMLLLLCAVMVMKYVFGVQLFLFTPDGFAKFEPLAPEGIEADFAPAGFDLFKAILIAHGWFYVVYLFACFRVWSLMRWPFLRFILLALGGVVPFLSFIMEVRVAREVKAYLAKRDPSTGSGTDPEQSSTTPATEGAR